MQSKTQKPKKENSEKIAFVICPIGEPESDIRKRSDQILKHVIEPAVLECGYKAIRADKISEPGIITSQVITHIMNDELVIADLTGYNPNVFYELAVRHVMKKPVVQIIQKGEKIPFDVSVTRTIPIDHKDLDNVEEAKKELNKQIRAAEKDPTKVDSPISVAVDLQSLRQSEDPQRKAIAELRTIAQQTNTAINEIKELLRQNQPRLFEPQNIRTPFQEALQEAQDRNLSISEWSEILDRMRREDAKRMDREKRHR